MFWKRKSDVGESRSQSTDLSSKSTGLPSIGQVLSDHLVVLQHPETGSQVYVIGTSHLSPQSVEIVRQEVQRLRPAVVLVELDKRRLALMKQQWHNPMDPRGDFNMSQAALHGRWELFTRQMNTGLTEAECREAMAEVGLAALMGVRMGADMMAAVHAAKEVGAQLVPADRAPLVTRTRVIQQCLERGLDKDTAGPNLLLEVAERYNDSDTWWKEFVDERGEEVRAQLERDGCDNAQEAMEAMARIVKAADSRRKRVPKEDISSVRRCGASVAEKRRRDGFMGVGGAAGMFERGVGLTGSQMAGGGPHEDILEEVAMRERQLLMARRLWEAGAQSKGEPVVGVMGAFHVPGIRAHWASAGTPESEQLAEHYLVLPELKLSPKWREYVQAFMIGGGFALGIHRAPKFLAGMTMAGLLLGGSFWNHSYDTTARFQAVVEKLARSCKSVRDDVLQGTPQPDEGQ